MEDTFIWDEENRENPFKMKHVMYFDILAAFLFSFFRVIRAHNTTVSCQQTKLRAVLCHLIHMPPHEILKIVNALHIRCMKTTICSKDFKHKT